MSSLTSKLFVLLRSKSLEVVRDSFMLVSNLSCNDLDWRMIG